MSGNLFAVIAGALVTPPLADGALPGGMRGVIMAERGAEERPLTPADLARTAGGASKVKAMALALPGDAWHSCSRPWKRR